MDYVITYAIVAIFTSGAVLGYAAMDDSLKRDNSGLELVATSILIGSIWPIVIVAALTMVVIGRARGK